MGDGKLRVVKVKSVEQLRSLPNEAEAPGAIEKAFSDWRKTKDASPTLKVKRKGARSPGSFNDPSKKRSRVSSNSGKLRNSSDSSNKNSENKPNTEESTEDSTEDITSGEIKKSEKKDKKYKKEKKEKREKKEKKPIQEGNDTLVLEVGSKNEESEAKTTSPSQSR